MIELMQNIYNVLGFQIEANIFDVYGASLSIIMILATTIKLFSISKIATTKPLKQVDPLVEKKPEENWNNRLHKGLSKSRTGLWSKITSAFSQGISDDLIDEVEEVLYGADLGPQATQQILSELKNNIGNQEYTVENLKIFIKEILLNKMSPVQQKLTEDLFQFTHTGKTKVIMVVGVNGAGKTTTIGKLATKLKRQGATVVVGACDTFRAAAVDQLQVWCDRAGVQMVRAKENSDPSGVGYEALQVALKEKADYCLLDTAGRLHTKSNLMQELAKSKNVLSKLDVDAPHEVLLVIDAITGQNALRQAEEFNETLGLTGLIFTKCDGSSKAGSAVNIVDKLQVPISYIGVGETVEDLNRFDVNQYLDAMLN